MKVNHHRSKTHSEQPRTAAGGLCALIAHDFDPLH